MLVFAITLVLTLSISVALASVAMNAALWLVYMAKNSGLNPIGPVTTAKVAANVVTLHKPAKDMAQAA